MDWARRVELVSVLLASLVAVVGLWYSGVQTRQANEQAREERALVKEGQITDRYTAAVNNLGEDKMDVRLGGIYALERIMQDSYRDQLTIANFLAAYIRTPVTKPPASQNIPAGEPPAKGQGIPSDVHAALTVLTMVETDHDTGFRPDLRSAWLPEAELASTGHEADLASANLTNSDLRGANREGADLRGADLMWKQLISARMDERTKGRGCQPGSHSAVALPRRSMAVFWEHW
ncbi:pentapeptide repeat-containing protein [Streptomyces scopuliridis]|uniref:pentapeptide repeat-containing protein n=1 Tax=Streptomyces scopuliridis TaxID=452529 RepID=UPI0036AD9F67